MGKLSKAQKRQRIEASFADDGGSCDGEDISLLDIATTARTLKYLHAHPNQIRAARYREVRVALHPLLDEHMKRNSGTCASTPSSAGPLDSGLTERISDSITEKDFSRARQYLKEMQQRSIEPKLGAVQRWIRALETDYTDDKLLTLDAILRVTKQYTRQSQDKESDGAEAVVVTRHAPWTPVEREKIDSQNDKENIPLLTDVKKHFRVVGQSAWQQGVHTETSLPIYYTDEPLIKFDADSPSRAIDVPFVEGARVISSALTPSECAQVIHCAEALEFTVDPLGGPEQVEWLASEAFMATLYERCRAHLPPALCGDEVRGINRRMRVYRFKPGTQYRPHVDGAWPASGLKDGKYVYDLEPGTVRSRLTMILYLQDVPDGGETSFFMASRRGEGHIDVFSVAPQTGNALVFPHGDTTGALVHEGSEVRKGLKYIIRTEVLYTTKIVEKKR